jgi:hypothetical protein
MVRRGWRGLWLVGLLVLLGGCADLKPYRVSGGACLIDQPESDGRGGFDWESAGNGNRPCADKWQVSVARPVPFSMNFVEIDEQGVLASRAQAEAAIANASAQEPEGSYVVVFVHGWHHNASTDDSNVQGFYNALASVSAWNPNRKVKGIYIGWRGDSLPIPGLRYLTFWDRKSTSEEVGRGSLLEFLLRLENGVKGTPTSRNRLVVVGHSFGASVTFNALAHVYLERFLAGVQSTAEAPRFRGYGDLVVLINPAIEAMRYMPFQSAIDYYQRPAARPRADFTHELQPALVVLSSESDWATHRAFPAARFFSTWFEKHNRISALASPDDEGLYSEWNMDRDTIGNFEGFQTHAPIHLAAATSMPESGDESLASGMLNRCKSLASKEVRRLINVEEGSEGPVDAFPDSRILVRRLKDSSMGSPYIVAEIGKEIVNGHTDIGRPNLVCWINQLLDTKETSSRMLADGAGTGPGVSEARVTDAGSTP